MKKHLPNAHLAYALPGWISRLYQNVEIDADEVISMELATISGQFSFLNTIRKGKYDAIIELHESSRTHRIVKAARFLFGTPYFSHNHHLSRFHLSGNHDQGIRKAISQRDLDGAFSFLRFFEIVSSPPEYLDNLPKIKVKSVDNSDTIILGIVATREEKKWPLEHYAKLINLLASQHNNLKFCVPVSPSKEDQLAVTSLQSLCKENIEVLCVPLESLAIKLSSAMLYIGNDTGLKHICAALGVRTLTVFGPEEPLEWHPYDKSRHPYFWIYGNDVRTKMVDVCLLKQFDRSKNISEISPEEVFVTASSMI